MAICPFAVWRPLPEQGRQRATEAKRLAILHSAVDGSASSLWNFFRNSTDLESHFYVREDGLIEQYLDTDQRADANRFANDEAISIETDDHSDPDTRPWSPAQVRSIVRLLDWCCDVHPLISRDRANGPAGRGIGWHTMWGAPSDWTPVNKSCPGRARIAQMPGIIWEVAVLGLPPTDGDDDLQPDERQMLKTLADVLVSSEPNHGPGSPPRVMKVLDSLMWAPERAAENKAVAEAAKVAAEAATGEAKAARAAVEDLTAQLRALLAHLGIERPA